MSEEEFNQLTLAFEKIKDAVASLWEPMKELIDATEKFIESLPDELKEAIDDDG